MSEYRAPCGVRLNSTAEDHRCHRIPVPGYTRCWQHGGPTRRKAADRVVRFLRRLVSENGRAFVGLSPFVLRLELSGLVRIPGAQDHATMVEITEAGRAAAEIESTG